MKKVLKGLFVAMMLMTVCISFAGCGDKGKKSNGDRIVASKKFEAGNYSEKMEVYFENGKASKFIIVFEFEKEDNAKAIKERLEERDSMKNSKIEIDGSKVTVEISAEDFFKEEGLEYNDEKASKDGIKQIFNDNGFTIDEE